MSGEVTDFVACCRIPREVTDFVVFCRIPREVKTPRRRRTTRRRGRRPTRRPAPRKVSDTPSLHTWYSPYCPYGRVH
jgi:hypothetical protein